MQGNIPLEKLDQAFNIILKSTDTQKLIQKQQNWKFDSLKKTLRTFKNQNFSIIINSLIKQINCASCLTNPKEFTLHCEHSYCANCLVQTLSKNNQFEILCEIDGCMDKLNYSDFERLLKSKFVYRNYQLNEYLLRKIKSIDEGFALVCEICSCQTEFLSYVEDGICLCTICCFSYLHSIPASGSDSRFNDKFGSLGGMNRVISVLDMKVFRCGGCGVGFKFTLLFFPCECCPGEGYCISCFVDLANNLDCPKCLGPLNSYLLARF